MGQSKELPALWPDGRSQGCAERTFGRLQGEMCRAALMANPLHANQRPSRRLRPDHPIELRRAAQRERRFPQNQNGSGFTMPRTEHGLRGAIQRPKPSQQIPLGMRDANSKFQRRKHRHSMSMEQSSADASEKMRRRFWPPRACMKRFPAMEAFDLACIGRRHF